MHRHRGQEIDACLTQDVQVVGEPLELFPFLGSGRLAEPLALYPVVAVIHGHAHNGTMEGVTAAGAPVSNVAMPLLRKHAPNELPALFIDVETEGPPQPVNADGGSFLRRG